MSKELEIDTDTVRKKVEKISSIERIKTNVEKSVGDVIRGYELDGVKDPYWVKSSGIFKNTDCYSTIAVSVTYSFSAKCKTCNKEE